MKNKIINCLVQVPFLWKRREVFNDGRILIVYTHRCFKGIECCILKEHDKGLNWVINLFVK